MGDGKTSKSPQLNMYIGYKMMTAKAPMFNKRIPSIAPSMTKFRRLRLNAGPRPRGQNIVKG